MAKQKKLGVKAAYQMLSIASLLDNSLMRKALEANGYKIQDGIIHTLRANAMMILVKDAQATFGWDSHSILNSESSI
jgi:hypothetical protein